LERRRAIFEGSMRFSIFEHAQNDNMLGPRRETFHVEPSQPQNGAKDRVRPPLKVDERDLESAIDDVLASFPKTLKYLAR
jgi:hypothetical protein